MSVLEQGQSLKNSLNQWLIEEWSCHSPISGANLGNFKEALSMTNDERL